MKKVKAQCLCTVDGQDKMCEVDGYLLPILSVSIAMHRQVRRVVNGEADARYGNWICTEQSTGYGIGQRPFAGTAKDAMEYWTETALGMLDRIIAGRDEIIRRNSAIKPEQAIKYH